MKKLRKIIKDIVRQEAEYARRTNSMLQLQKVTNQSHKRMIITEDGVGRH